MQIISRAVDPVFRRSKTSPLSWKRHKPMGISQSWPSWTLTNKKPDDHRPTKPWIGNCLEIVWFFTDINTRRDLSALSTRIDQHMWWSEHPNWLFNWSIDRDSFMGYIIKMSQLTLDFLWLWTVLQTLKLVPIFFSALVMNHQYS